MADRMFISAVLETWSLPVPQPPASQSCWMLPFPSSLRATLMRRTHPSFYYLIFKKGCWTTFTACTTPRRMHLMRWISRRLTKRLQRMYDGAQNACLLWMVPSHLCGGVICIPPRTPFRTAAVGVSYMSGGVYFPDIYFCYVFTLPIINDTLSDKVLDIDCKARKGNASASSMHIGFISTKTFEKLCK